MAPKTQAQRLNGPTTIDIDPDTGRIFDENEDTAELENDQDKLLDDIIGEFGAGDNEVSYSASVTRIPKNFQRGQKEPWLFECDAADIIGIRTKLRDVYRGGQFRIRVYKTTSRGKKLYRQMDYYIEAPTSEANPTGDTRIDAFAAALERTQSSMIALAERLSQPAQLAAPQTDTLLMMERMSAIFKNMQPAPAAHGDFSMKDGIELFTKGMELAEGMRGESGDSWISVFKEMAKQLPVADIVKNLSEMQANKNNPQRPQLRGPAQNIGQPRGPIQPMPATSATPETTPAATGQALEQSMRYLIGKARANSDPGLYAEWLLDNADRALIRQMANDPNVLDQLAVIFPALNQPPIRTWFGELVENVKEFLAQLQDNGDSVPGIDHSNAARAAQAGFEVGMNGQDAGTASFGAPDTGRGFGDQGNPENHAGVGQDGAA
jgi:hypothetical protein